MPSLPSIICCILCTSPLGQNARDITFDPNSRILSFKEEAGTPRWLAVNWGSAGSYVPGLPLLFFLIQSFGCDETRLRCVRAIPVQGLSRSWGGDVRRVMTVSSGRLHWRLDRLHVPFDVVISY